MKDWTSGSAEQTRAMFPEKRHCAEAAVSEFVDRSYFVRHSINRTKRLSITMLGSGKLHATLQVEWTRERCLGQGPYVIKACQRWNARVYMHRFDITMP
jgi:hypothetical protein